jgi:hypothetical protein
MVHSAIQARDQKKQGIKDVKVLAAEVSPFVFIASICPYT